MNNENSALGNIYNDIVCAYACPSTEWKPHEGFILEPTIQIQGNLILCAGTICLGWDNGNPCECCVLNRLFSRYYENKIKNQTLRQDP